MTAFLKYIPSDFKKLLKIAYLEKTWKHKKREVVRAERLYTAGNYQSLVRTFKANFPQYVYHSPLQEKEIVCPQLSCIQDIHPSRECARHLRRLRAKDDLQKATVELTELLSTQSQIDIEDFGLHGSIALNMHTPTSDIDLVVFGANNFRKLEESVKRLAESDIFTFIFKNRIEQVRHFKAKYKGRVFMYNAVRKAEEIKPEYGMQTYRRIAPVTFNCKIKDDSEAMFRPAIYRIDDYCPEEKASELNRTEVPIKVVSMIGCYRNVARKGENIRVSGMLEQVTDSATGSISHQVVVGSGIVEEEYIWPCGS